MPAVKKAKCKPVRRAPVRYTHPELKKPISAELKKRMQGKACFNFRSPDQELFRELADLTQSGLEKYRAKGWM